MSKKKILGKQESCSTTMQTFNFDRQKIKNLEEVRPELFFQNHAKVGAALLQSLLENDTEAFIEILDSYLRVNRSRAAKNAHLSRATVQQALSKKGNPTLKTLAKIAHHEVGYLYSERASKLR